MQSGVGIVFAGSTTFINGTFEPTYFQHTGGLTYFNVPFSSSSALVVSAGTLQFNSNSSLSSLAVVSQVNFNAPSSVGTLSLRSGERCTCVCVCVCVFTLSPFVKIPR